MYTFTLNVSYLFASGFNPASQSSVFGKVIIDGGLATVEELDREDYHDHSIFKFWYVSFDKNIRILIKFEIQDNFHPDGLVLCEHVINEKSEPPPSGLSGLEGLGTFLAKLIQMLLLFLILAGMIFVMIKLMKRIRRKKGKSWGKKKNSPIQLQLELKGGAEALDRVGKVFQDN